jgi:DNA-binding transcriptional MocR family regulator
MYNVYAALYLFGADGHTPWARQEKIKIICPCPGYDRHFGVTADFGAEMIVVPLNDDGPDMDAVERIAAEDPSVKGIWCVPLYSNPTGCVYSVETARRLAEMRTAAPDFRIFWDNAYGVHHLFDEHSAPDILKLTADAGNPERAYYFFSTSKINFPGAGIGLVASGPENIKSLSLHLTKQTIGFDKLMQLKTVRFFDGKADNIRVHMKEIAELLRPRFELVLNVLDREFSGSGLLDVVVPKGGYFISVNTLNGCAKRVVALAKDAGAVLTNAGATYPHGNDPSDSNIRIAPTYPSLDELAQTMELFCSCVRIASAEKLLSENG